MFTTLVAIGIIGIQLSILIFAVLWYTNSPLLVRVRSASHIGIALLFISSALGSLIFEYIYGFEPCLLCWYQRIAIFGIAILSLTGDIRKNRTLQKQVFIFSLIGLIVALVHNYIDIVPGSSDLCGTGASCLKRYIYEFGYITIPIMSLTILLAGALVSLFLLRRPLKDGPTTVQ